MRRQSPPIGGKLRPYYFAFAGKPYRPEEIHQLFHGRSHLTFGWSHPQLDLTLPWDHLPDYCAAVVEDALTLFGRGERPSGYVLGWMTHLVGDGLMKSIAPG